MVLDMKRSWRIHSPSCPPVCTFFDHVRDRLLTTRYGTVDRFGSIVVGVECLSAYCDLIDVRGAAFVRLVE